MSDERGVGSGSVSAVDFHPLSSCLYLYVLFPQFACKPVGFREHVELYSVACSQCLYLVNYYLYSPIVWLEGQSHSLYLPESLSCNLGWMYR